LTVKNIEPQSNATPPSKTITLFSKISSRDRTDSMHNSQLVEILQCFTPDEIEEFKLFTASPFYNRGIFVKETQGLLEFITASSFNPDALSRDSAYRFLFQDSKWVEGKLDKIISELHKLCRKFIETTTYHKPQNQFRHLLDQAQFFADCKLETRYLNTIQKLEGLLSSSQKQELSFFQNRFWLDYEHSGYSSIFNRKKGDLHLLKTIESLELLSYAYKIELTTRFLLQQKETKLPIPEDVLNSLKLIKVSDELKSRYPVLAISEKIAELLMQELPDPDDFGALQNMLKAYESIISFDTLKMFHSHLRNFCTFLVMGGHSQYLPTLFQFQQEHYERGYVFYHGRMAPHFFINTVNIAFRVGQMDWAKNFIEDNQFRIDNDQEDHNIYRLALAQYYFNTQNYENGLEILPSHLAESDMNLQAKRLEIKMYYEQGSSDLLSYKIEAFKMHLYRASQTVLSEQVKERNNNFALTVFHLNQAAKGDKKRAEQIMKRIQKAKGIAEREWLIEKVEKRAKGLV
jgi:hypothetical protein